LFEQRSVGQELPLDGKTDVARYVGLKLASGVLKTLCEIAGSAKIDNDVIWLSGHGVYLEMLLRHGRVLPAAPGVPLLANPPR
jgi:hypothetical protein